MRGVGGGGGDVVRRQGVDPASSVMRSMTLSTSKKAHGLCCCLSSFLGAKCIVGEIGGGGRVFWEDKKMS